MKVGIWFIFFQSVVSLFLFQYSALAGDIQSQIENREVLIGQPFEVKYSVSNQLVKFSPYWDFSSFDDRSDLVVIRSTEEETENYFLLRKKLVLFDTGRVVIPSLMVISNMINELDTFYSKELEVTVLLPEDFVPELLPIRGIIEEPPASVQNWHWLAGLLVVVALALLTLFILKKKKKEKSLQSLDIEINPSEEALNALQSLRDKGLVEKGEINRYHSELNYIFRRWIERRFSIEALGMTGRELSAHLREIGVGEARIRDWTEMLSTIDGIKYARGKPSADFHNSVFMEVKDMVEKEADRERNSQEKEKE